jgi:hypothetical protein
VATTPTEHKPRFSRSEDYVLRFLAVQITATMAQLEANADACTPIAARRSVYGLVQRKLIERCDGGGNGVTATYRLRAVNEQPVKTCENL